MGFAKNRMMEIEEQGYDCTIDKRICSCCVKEDYALSNYIKANGNRKKCDYCGKIFKSIHFEDFCDFVVRNIKKVYSSPIEDLYYDDEDPTGFLGGTELNCQDSYDLIMGLGCFDDNVCKDLIQCLQDDTWCDDPYEIFDSTFSDAWNEFCNKVKKEDKDLFNIIVNDGFNEIEYDLFFNVIEMIKILKLIKILKKGTLYYRTRIAEYKHKEWSGKDLGSAPSENAKNNRMSKEGESVFYGAFDDKTCIAEVSNNQGYICIV